MKVICDCGAKYAFDATPEMVRQPIVFACPTCGVDLSARMNDLARQQFQPTAAAPVLEIAPPPPGAAIVPSAVAPSSPPPAAPPMVRINRGGAGHEATKTNDVKDARFCPKHPQDRATEQCVVCGKGICPKCMVLFGYVCSPHCKEKAALQGIDVPEFEGQRDAVQSKHWRKVGLVAGGIGVLLAALLGVWIWYEWFGSRPHPIVTLRFEAEPARFGTSVAGAGDQMIFLHGDKLGRYDLKQKKEIWRRHLVDPKKVAAAAAAEIKTMQDELAKSEFKFKIPSLEELTKLRLRGAEQSQRLRVLDHNLWVSDGDTVRRFDWDTGEPRQEVAFNADFTAGVLCGDTLEFRERVGAKRMSVTRFNLANGKVDRDELGEPVAPAPDANLAALLASAGGKAGLAANAKKLNPQQLGAAVANAPLAGKLAAPATLSVARRQQEALDAMEEMDTELPTGEITTTGQLEKLEAWEEKQMKRERSTLIPIKTGFVQITSKMTEKNIVTRSAAKAAPKKSALDGPVNAAATMDIANEILNEMSRNAGADLVREDLSKYHVKIHLGGGPEVPDWEGDVVGAPELYPQTTVNVLTAGKTVIVLDLQNKKKWESTLMYPVSGGGSFLDFDLAERHGLGPVVERSDTVYVYDQGVLSAFDLATGTARWRLPSVGITGMFFDEQGMIYLNTTTASPDKIKYSRQIDVMDNTGDIVLKIDPKDGKEIWKHSMGGRIAYLSGKYIYTLSYTPPRDDDDEPNENLAALQLQSQPYIRIRRINPKNGRVLWDHYQPRGALDVQIKDNTFQLVLKKEVQVLRFISL